MFGAMLSRAGAGPRPQRVPARPRREPARLERQPDDRAERARPHPRHPRARRQGRRGRPAPHADRRGGRRAPRDRPGHRRPLPVRDRARALRRGARRPGPARTSTATGSTRSSASPRSSRPSAVAGHCGIEAARSAGSRASSRPRRAPPCYGRIGTCTQEFGTLASWLVDVVNVLTGNLDREGGAMFTPRGRRRSATRPGRPGAGKGVKLGRWKSRVRGLPEAFGELPVVCLAEEIETPGEGQVRALVTLAGNPVVSTPRVRAARRARSSRSTSWSRSTST